MQVDRAQAIRARLSAAVGTCCCWGIKAGKSSSKQTDPGEKVHGKQSHVQSRPRRIHGKQNS